MMTLLTRIFVRGRRAGAVVFRVCDVIIKYDIKMYSYRRFSFRSLIRCIRLAQFEML